MTRAVENPEHSSGSAPERAKKVKLAFVLAAGFFPLIAFSRPAPALADFAVCNRTPAVVRLAVAADWFDYYNPSPTLSRSLQQKVDHYVAGWSTIGAGACAEVIPYNISDLTIYIYAFAPSDRSENWYGEYKRCIDLKRNFAYGESVGDHETLYAYMLNSCGNYYPNCVNMPLHPQAAGKISARVPCTSGSAVGMLHIETNGVGHYIDTLTK
jgi:uncharacterized membrane protein